MGHTTTEHYTAVWYFALEVTLSVSVKKLVTPELVIGHCFVYILMEYTVRFGKSFYLLSGGDREILCFLLSLPVFHTVSTRAFQVWYQSSTQISRMKPINILQHCNGDQHHFETWEEAKCEMSCSPTPCIYDKMGDFINYGLLYEVRFTGRKYWQYRTPNN
jgi:hypothetical protein